MFEMTKSVLGKIITFFNHKGGVGKATLVYNLGVIFKSWIDLLGPYQTTHSFQGLSFKPKFLGLVVQMVKRFNGGAAKEEISLTRFSNTADKWIEDLNKSVRKFQTWTLDRDKSISETDFKLYFSQSTPFIIAKCCDFTPQLRSIAEKAGVPVVELTQELCDQYGDSSAVNITKKMGNTADLLTALKSRIMLWQMV